MADCPELKNLILSFNKLKEGSDSILSTCILLESLDLSDNQFKVLPLQIMSLIGLKRLDLRNNHISQLPPEHFFWINYNTFLIQENQ